MIIIIFTSITVYITTLIRNITFTNVILATLNSNIIFNNIIFVIKKISFTTSNRIIIFSDYILYNSNIIITTIIVVMLTLNLTPIFKARGIDRPYATLVKAGISRMSAGKILNGTTRIFRLDHIEIICTILNCEPNDLLQWTPTKNQVYPTTHPLSKLKQTDISSNIRETLSTIPLKQLKELDNIIINQNKENINEP
ncbi:helix-turn-helix transcriptional regulator [Ferruginibacter lapsinanis]|uniref:helix-turn-helix domain-containing protein n=1 Tax=Ferruginibacter lapsinanis TaxID=563172 RepID=UPI001E285614|nr:helix-turn-helix transcriptional regulator [Ferruginibacter lapsinanis]UEG49623.1 helix-turn-helix transcriptional regulator [Ferruginibacter lapsinanis]